MLFYRPPPATLRNILILTRPSLKPAITTTFNSRAYSITAPPSAETSTTKPAAPLLHYTLSTPGSTGAIHLLLLNSPQTRNALSLSLLSHLQHSLSTITTSLSTTTSDHPPARAVILSSTNPEKSFCAGADLKERATFTKAQTTAFLTSLRNLFTTLDSLPIPTISAINGPALGGGLEMALSTDFRILGDSALVGLPETKLAIIPGAGGTYRLPRVIGESKALELILTGRKLSAREALEIGLATRVIPANSKADSLQQSLTTLPPSFPKEALEDTSLLGAISFANEICSGGPIAIRAAKEAVRGWRGGEEVENRAYEKVVGTKDRDEALVAFREKRRPVFRGE